MSGDGEAHMTKKREEQNMFSGVASESMRDHIRISGVMLSTSKKKSITAWTFAVDREWMPLA